MELTKQQHSPHPSLVEVRNKIMAAGHSRAEACVICNGLTDEQCDEWLSGESKAEKPRRSRKKPVAKAGK